MRRAARPRSLFEGENWPPRTERAPPPDSTPKSAAGQTAAYLWVGIHLPDFCIEVLPHDSARACLVSEAASRNPLVVACNELARQAGVHAGISVNAAFALLPDLVVVPRDAAREQAVLQQLAGALMKFSPAVSIAKPALLLLEISGSLRFFGGYGALEARLEMHLEATGYSHAIACAPTARAAQWLAMAGAHTTVRSLDALAGVLASMPVACLGWPEAELCALDQMGLETLGDCFRLPRHGFGRRFGKHRLRELDEGLGRTAQTLRLYNPPAHFSECVELESETSDCNEVLALLTPVLARLEVFLRRHQAGVSALLLALSHRGLPDTHLRVGLIQPATRAVALRELMEIRLERAGLTAGVIGIGVQAELRQDCMGEQASLFAGWQTGQCVSVPELVQRLCSRLGERAVHRVSLVAEHRPESAWQSLAGYPARTSSGATGTNPGSAAMDVASALRPLWMLESPLALAEGDRAPAYRGPLCLEVGPERIETGWWDGRDIRRDYYLASNSAGERLWIYRELRTGCWYLHGFFG